MPSGQSRPEDSQKRQAKAERSMGEGWPIDTSARISPTAAECLNPCPEQGEATQTSRAAGCRSMRKPKSGVTV